MRAKKLGYLVFVLAFGVIVSCSDSGSSGDDITAFSINGVAGTINEVSITVALPAGTAC